MMRHAVVLSAALVSVVGCSGSGDGDPGTLGSGAHGDVGVDPGDGGFQVDVPASESTDETPTGPTSRRLTAILRDFKVYDASDPHTNPDFENVPKVDPVLGPWDDRGIVTDTLGPDGLPVYASTTTTLTTHGKAAFDQWYRDVDGTNIKVLYPIDLAANPDGSYGYDSEKTGVPLSASDPTKMFFPLDDGTPYATAFGNQGMPHDYSFTVELHTTFVYRGGEFFQFRGDDDVFVFIDGKRVIDLGGIHGPETATVHADDLGLAKGSEYRLDFFSAERHVVGSNILFTTTLDLKPAPIH